MFHFFFFSVLKFFFFSFFCRNPERLFTSQRATHRGRTIWDEAQRHSAPQRWLPSRSDSIIYLSSRNILCQKSHRFFYCEAETKLISIFLISQQFTQGRQQGTKTQKVIRNRYKRRMEIFSCSKRFLKVAKNSMFSQGSAIL